MNLKTIDLVVGYIFLGLACLGCVAIASHLLDLKFFNHNGYYAVFFPSSSGGMASAPFFMAIVAGVGAYLVKK